MSKHINLIICISFLLNYIFTEDLYKILGITKNSTLSEVKKAFKSLSIKYHPDKNNDEDIKDIYTKIVNAYEVLSDVGRKY